MPIDYRTGKIYMLIAPNLRKNYIGSTIQTLNKRMTAHRSKYNRRDRTDYTSAFQVLEDADAYITLLENYPCNNKNELEIREGYYQSTIECVNINQAGRTPTQRYIDNKPRILEYKKQFYIDNKPRLLAYKKRHYQDNRPRILRYRRRHYRANRPRILQNQKERYEAKKYNLHLDLLFKEI